MSTSINEVTKEQIVIALYITTVIWDSPQIKEAHQILILTMNVAENFDWRVNSQDHRLF